MRYITVMAACVMMWGTFGSGAQAEGSTDVFKKFAEKANLKRAIITDESIKINLDFNDKMIYEGIPLGSVEITINRSDAQKILNWSSTLQDDKVFNYECKVKDQFGMTLKITIQYNKNLRFYILNPLSPKNRMQVDVNGKTPTDPEFQRPEFTKDTTDSKGNSIDLVKTQVCLASTSPQNLDSAGLITGRNGMKFTQKGDKSYLTCYKYPDTALGQIGRLGALVGKSATIKIDCELTPLLAYRLWDFYGKRRLVNMYKDQDGKRVNNFNESQDTIEIDGVGSDGKNYTVRIRCDIGRVRVYSITLKP